MLRNRISSWGLEILASSAGWQGGDSDIWTWDHSCPTRGISWTQFWAKKKIYKYTSIMTGVHARLLFGQECSNFKAVLGHSNNQIFFIKFNSNEKKKKLLKIYWSILNKKGYVKNYMKSIYVGNVRLNLFTSLQYSVRLTALSTALFICQTWPANILEMV